MEADLLVIMVMVMIMAGNNDNLIMALISSDSGWSHKAGDKVYLLT
jgi:hypothetical protein